MGRNLLDIENLFRDSIEAHEEMPPEKVWNEIDHTLDKKSEASTKRKYNRLKRLSAVLLLFLLGTIAYELQTTYKNKFSSNADFGNTNISKNKMNNKSEAAHDNIIAVPFTRRNNTAGKDSSEIAANNTVDNNTKQPVDKIRPAANPTAKPDAVKYSSNAVSATKPNLYYKKEKINNAVEIKVVSNFHPGLIKNKMTPAVKTGIVVHAQNPAKHTDFNSAEDQLPSNETTLNVIASPHQALMGQRSATETEAGKKEKNLHSANIQRMPSSLVYDVNTHAPLLQPDIQSAPTVVAKKQNTVHYSLMPFVAPQFNFNHIVDNDDIGMGGQRQDDADDIKNGENHQRSYSFGLLIDIPLKKRWSLQSGVSYIYKIAEINPKRIYARNDNGSIQYRFDFSSGYTYLSTKNGTPAAGDSILATENSSILQYIGIPVAINYRFLNGKFNIIPTVGAMVNFLIDEKIQTNVETGSSNDKQSIKSIQGLKKMYLNSITGITFQYNAGKRLAIDITPSANFALGTINNNAAVKSYPNAFSIAAGLKIYF
ncbi:outer membrane beta-barrel protein [Chitinophagaceae bacterium 26-R-25]|nr:outer membrane beta-barrel protein [Chitinophagaceae bacterium 26-R-25]